MPPTYRTTRLVMLRLLGLVTFVAFLGAWRQGPALIGHDGLLPVDRFVDRVVQASGSQWAAFKVIPSIFVFGISDAWLLGAALLGLALSAATMAGFTSGLSLLVQWAVYLSISHVGQLFYGYGWENQLCETLFLAAFLVPFLDARRAPTTPPPTAVIWLFRWLTFRIMLGAGLIKLRGDPCWRDLTCLDFHFETQPIPNPLTPLFHFAPGWMHAAGVAFNHVVEVGAAFFVFGPRPARHVAGVLMLVFQITLILSGNLSFLNWLTIVPILACFDDSLWGRLLPARVTSPHPSDVPEIGPGHRYSAWVLVVVVLFLSPEPILNLLSSKQIMNTSHDPFEIVNSYGAFGSVGRDRHEVVFEGSNDGVTWLAYEFPCKPGDPARRPCWTSPYHQRLTWQLWFAAMSRADEEPWAVHLAWKLLHGDPLATGMLEVNPFPVAPPRLIRARWMKYALAPLGSERFWDRSDDGEWLPALAKDDERLVRFLRGNGLIE